MHGTDAIPVLRVEGASKAFGARRALAGVTLEVAAGQFVGLLGPNGAGKTTLFQLLSGLLAPDAGELRLFGRSIRMRPAEALARLGIVFQQPTLDLDLTVRANLQFHARLHGLPPRTARLRIAEELERLGMDTELNRRCRELSGGNRRKVELARALLHRPPLLLMDEATVGLDPGSRYSLLAYVRGLCAERGLGVLWATHLVEEVEDADRVMILSRGSLLHAERPEVLIRNSGRTTLAEAFLALIA